MTERPVSVRTATPDELPVVMGVFDAAMLEVDAAAVSDRLAADHVHVAEEEGRILGACVVDLDEPGVHADVEGNGVRVEAIAVRPGRRGQGIGAALVDAAADRGEVVTAEFDGRVRRFYEALGFDVEPLGDGRFLGIR